MPRARCPTVVVHYQTQTLRAHHAWTEGAPRGRAARDLLARAATPEGLGAA
jgi:hypothetical protein